MLCQQRAAGTRLVVANSEVPQTVLHRFEAAGFQIETRELGNRSQTEQANDELLQVRMLLTCTDSRVQPPGAIVLATGDGNGWRRGRGFGIVLERARLHGWRIEVASWKASLNPHLARVVAASGGRLELLDDSYYAITFVLGGRQPMPIVHYPR